VDDDEHDDIEDASYADEEYGAKKKPAKKKKRVRTPTISAIRPKGWCASMLRRHTLNAFIVPRQSSMSDSDSDYGSKAHKKKKKQHRSSTEEVRVSHRGGKVPNYLDDVQDFETYEEDDELGASYYIDPNQTYQEEDEIEAVLGHSRDEGREEDPEDVWTENIVSV